jgi:hypothetical protein
MDHSDFIKYFKTINIYPKMEDKSNDFTPSTASIINWTGRYDAFFRKKLNMGKDENINALQNRTLSVHGEGILQYLQRIIDLATFSTSIGYIYLLTLDIKEILSNFEKVEYLIIHRIISSLGIIIEEDDEIKENEKFARECEATLLKIADYKINIGLMASIETLYRLKILDSSNYNSLIFTINPINKTRDEHFCINPITSCLRHLKLVINEDGLIYSCLGLVGLQEYAIGSIYDPIDETFLDGSHSKLDFEELIRQGAPINTERIQSKIRLTGLPQMCELHRLSLPLC